MKRFTILATAILGLLNVANAKTLVAYYSFTNNIHTIVTDLQTQLSDADVIRIEPAEEGLDYAANNYALGSALISAIRENPNDAASYPEIKPVTVDFSLYDEIIVAAPLWWSNMAAPMQTFLFHNGLQMAGKRIGLIVSSASSGISGVEADARRLIPEGNFVSPSLWIRSYQTSNCHEMTAEWLEETGIGNEGSGIAEVNDVSEAVITCDGNLLNVNGSFDRLCLYDMSGMLRVETSEQTVNVDNLPSGIYLAHLRQGNSATACRIMIK